jgi:uncharacterized membrane protein YraQ (UPF0718 family)
MKQKGDTEKAGKKRAEDKYHGIYFLGSVVFLYLLLFLFNPVNVEKALRVTANALIQILPSLLLIILLMSIMNYFVSPGAVSKYVGKGSGIKGWFLAIFTGILSHGPVYGWYPLLRDLRNQGMKSGLIAAFLYNRAIKIPLLPLMVYYFGTRFVLIFTCYIVVASIVQGWIIQMIEK